MVVTDLKKAQQARARKSNRKHEGVRNPKARNTIVRDRETNEYQAVTDGGELADFANEVLLRLNALELNYSRLKRDAAVDRGAAAPITVAEAVKAEVAAASDNVVPMDVARKAKEQSKAVPVTSSPGNEAEVLQVLPVPSAEPPLKVADVEPKHIGKAAPVSSRTAANDDGYETLSRIMMPEDLGFVAELAEAYEMPLLEASEILGREYERRLRHCEQTHGKPRSDVRLERTLRRYKAGVDVYIHAENCVTRFADWWHESEAAAHVARRMPKKVWPSKPARLVKGEAKYRKRTALRRAASARRANRDGFVKVLKVSHLLHVGPGPDSGSQIKALTTAAWELYQKGRKLFRRKPTIRNSTLRTRYEVMADYVHQHTEATGSAPVHGPLTEADYESKQSELVRRYQRTGIGY